MDGGLIISLPPPSFDFGQGRLSAEKRIANVLGWCADKRSLFPFFWIDPLEKGASDQVGLAVSKGVMGFKIICNRFYPGDRSAMKVYRAIADTGRPILFHSGILWDGKVSSKYNRPVEFEALMEVKGLRFAMAHISWPWCDELIALYGKIANARRRRPDMAAELFVDTTPGTPAVYRKEALTKLYRTGYAVAENVFFGADSAAEYYHFEQVAGLMKKDSEILRRMKVPSADAGKYFSGNLLRFIGADA